MDSVTHSQPVSREAPPRVLFVDDDAAFLETVKELMRTYSQGRWEVLTAPGASQAFGILQEQPLDLAVIDVQMPVMDGVQMLSLLNRGYPRLQKVVLTGFANEKHRAACLSNGAELFLEKPKSADEWRSLYAALNELLKWGSPQGFRGVMRRVELAELIEMECAGRRSSVLEIKSDGGAGRIFVRAGALVHAAAGPRKGREALRRLLTLPGGDFKLLPFTDPPEQTLDGPWEELLLRARQPEEAVPAAPNLASEPAPPKPSSPAPPSEAMPPDASRPEVQAVLLCSAQGDLLHEWHCEDVDLWVKFLEFVSQKSQRLAHGVALGDFDRLEIFRQDSRIVIIIGPDRGVMIRTKRVGPGLPDAANPGGARLALSEAAKEQFGQWLRGAPSTRGVLVRGIRFPDQTMTCDLDSRDFPVSALEQSVRSVADTFQVLMAHRQAASRLVWTCQRAALHCVRRNDGAILAVVALTKPGEADTEGLARLLSQFQELSLSGT